MVTPMMKLHPDQMMKSKLPTVKYKLIICLIALQFITASGYAQAGRDDIIGIWLTTGKEPAKIQIYRLGEEYYGKIIWLKNATENGKPKVDNRNPDKNTRTQPIVGLVILKRCKFDGDNAWEDGEVYDPESGKTYTCILSLKDNNNL